MTSPLRKPDGISWQPAAVELPEIPLIPPGADAISATVAGVLPTLAAPLGANLAALSVKENTFSEKVGAAQAAYQSADESGGQSVGQLTSMLGQVGQLGQAAGAPAQAAGRLGGQTGMFGSLMQQAMQGPQGGGAPGTERLEHAEAGPDDSRNLAGPAPVTPPERPAGGDEDLGRRM